MNQTSIEEELLNKKAKLKTMQEKMELNNKKIKLLRKQNQELKNNANKRNQSDTAMLLQSKQLSDANSKLQSTIEQLQAKLQEPETSPTPTIVMIKETTVTQATVEIDLPKTELTDDDVMLLKGFSQIEEFILGENNLTNKSISMICTSFPNVKKLIINKNQFKADSLQNVGSLEKLIYLDIRDNKLGDQCLMYICESKSLTDLSLSNNNITDAGAINLTNLKHLTYLDITNNSLTDEGIKPILKLQKLTHLYLMSNQLTQKCIKDIFQELPNLKTLDIRFNKLSQEEKTKIREEKPAQLQLFC